MAMTKQINEPTPHGGVRAIATYTDDGGNPVDETVATRVVIKEYDQTGWVVYTTYMEKA